MYDGLEEALQYGKDAVAPEDTVFPWSSDFKDEDTEEERSIPEPQFPHTLHPHILHAIEPELAHLTNTYEEELEKFHSELPKHVDEEFAMFGGGKVLKLMRDYVECFVKET